MGWIPPLRTSPPPPYLEREARNGGKGEQQQRSTLHQKRGAYCKIVAGLVLAVVADLVDVRCMEARAKSMLACMHGLTRRKGMEIGNVLTPNQHDGVSIPFLLSAGARTFSFCLRFHVAHEVPVSGSTSPRIQ